MKGFTKDGKFHPIKPYNRVRKSRDNTTKEQGVRMKRTKGKFVKLNLTVDQAGDLGILLSNEILQDKEAGQKSSKSITQLNEKLNRAERRRMIESGEIRKARENIGVERQKRYDVTLYASGDEIDPVRYFDVGAKNIRDAKKLALKELKKIKFESNPDFNKFNEIVGDSERFPNSSELTLTDNVGREDKSGEFVFEVEIRERVEMVMIRDKNEN